MENFSSKNDWQIEETEFDFSEQATGENLSPAPFLKAENSQENFKTKGLPQKTVMWSLAVLGSFSLIFGGLRWFTSLRIPFAVQDGQEIVQLNNNTNKSVNLLDLKQKDTDFDGLNDYDELYFYQTSPYLPDTDSDSIADGIEVKNNQDPNCPDGQDCGLAVPAENSISLPASSDNLTPDQLRAVLLQSGLSEAEVNQLDDATLSQLYQEALNKKTDTIQAAANDNLSGLVPEEYSSFTPSQIRQLLKEQGVTEQELNNISDQDLMAGWQELLSQSSAGQPLLNAN